MKLFFVIIGLVTCVTASGQKGPDAKIAFSVDIASLIMNRSINIGFSHPLSAKWTSEGKIGIQIPEADKDEEKKEHEVLLGGRYSVKRSIAELSPELRMGARFWPSKALHGAYMGISCSYNSEKGTDLVLGCGYSAAIWKNIGMSAGYELKLIECLEGGIFNTAGITITIDYKF